MAASSETPSSLDFTHLIWDTKMQEMDAVLKSGGSWYDLVMKDQEERLTEVERRLSALQLSKKKGRWRQAAELTKEQAELRVALGRDAPETLDAYKPVPEEWAAQMAAEAETATPQKPRKPTEAPGAPKKPQVSLGMFGAFADSDSE